MRSPNSEHRGVIHVHTAAPSRTGRRPGRGDGARSPGSGGGGCAHPWCVRVRTSTATSPPRSLSVRGLETLLSEATQQPEPSAPAPPARHPLTREEPFPRGAWVSATTAPADPRSLCPEPGIQPGAPLLEVSRRSLPAFRQEHTLLPEFRERPSLQHQRRLQSTGQLDNAPVTGRRVRSASSLGCSKVFRDLSTWKHARERQGLQKEFLYHT